MKKAGSRTIFVATAVAVGLAASYSSWRMVREYQAKLSAAEQRTRAAQMQKAELLGKRSRLDDSAGREEIARERGYVKPGEQRLDP